jgi:hypothetical protein
LARRLDRTYVPAGATSVQKAPGHGIEAQRVASGILRTVALEDASYVSSSDSRVSDWVQGQCRIVDAGGFARCGESHVSLKLQNDLVLIPSQLLGSTRRMRPTGSPRPLWDVALGWSLSTKTAEQQLRQVGRHLWCYLLIITLSIRHFFQQTCNRHNGVERIGFTPTKEAPTCCLGPTNLRVRCRTRGQWLATQRCSFAYLRMEIHRSRTIIVSHCNTI